MATYWTMGKLLNHNTLQKIALYMLAFNMAPSIYAQNLVMNPSFEDFSLCPNVEGQFNGYINHWTTYFSSPDYYNKCGYYPSWAQKTYIFDGHGVTNSIFSFHITHKREYLHGKLISPLIANQLYFVEYYVYQYDSGIATNEYHAHLTNQIIDSNPSDGVLRLTPHIQYHGDIILADSGWTSIHGCYIAQGGEDKIILGNFYEDSATTSLILSLGSSNSVMVDQVGVYLIDDLRHRPDTLLYVGDTLCFPITDPRRYQLKGVGKLHQFIANEPGCFKFYYTLPSCDFLDSFNVCVIECPQSLELNVFGNYHKSNCVELNQPIFLNIPDSSLLVINEELITNIDEWKPMRGDNQIDISFPKCDLTDRYTLYYAECCEEDNLDSINCPVDPIPCTIFIPTAFSPNHDGINDIFTAFSPCQINQFSLTIFDKYGAKIYHSSDPTAGWDGTVNSMPVHNGIYVYLLEYYIEESKKIENGEFLLIK